MRETGDPAPVDASWLSMLREDPWDNQQPQVIPQVFSYLSHSGVFLPVSVSCSSTCRRVSGGYYTRCDNDTSLRIKCRRQFLYRVFAIYSRCSFLILSNYIDEMSFFLINLFNPLRIPTSPCITFHNVRRKKRCRCRLLYPLFRSHVAMQ